jgi:hypothetical protein
MFSRGYPRESGHLIASAKLIQRHVDLCRVSCSLIPAQAASLFFTLASRKPDVTLSRYAAVGDSAAEVLRCRNNTDAC